MEIEGIIVKFLNKEANIHELDALDFWLRDDDNIALFDHFVKTEYITILSMAEYDVDKAKAAIRQRLKNSKRRNRRSLMYRRIGIAASIALVLGTLFFGLYQGNRPTMVQDQTHEAIKAGSNKAILTLENGNEVVLERGKKYQTGKAKSNGEKLSYAADGKTKDNEREIEYNYLTIPRGGQFFVQLSDGTSVWLNSESKLKYPVKFQESKTRRVELVYGEAYFKVSPSTRHKGSEFHVLTKSQEISVLGTEFNIKAYIEEDEIATTLVEGTVNVKKGNINKVLKPNQQSTISSRTNAIDVREVDISQEISWVKGLFTFNEESLEDIMTALSRWYDVQVVFETAEQKDFVFTGIVERTESIDNILTLIEATSSGQVKFGIDDKTIHIR